jgi:NitT/TauT family transport system substrate-binding protein
MMHRSAFLLTSASVLAAASAPQPARAQTQPLSLRLAATANNGYDSGYYALDLGFFTRAGLNVDLETMSNGAAITAALTAGAIDVAVSTPIPIANAYLAGLPVVIVAAGAVSVPTTPSLLVCVSKNSPITTAKDLEGKTLGVNGLKTGLEVLVENWMAKNGGDPSKLSLVEVPFSDMALALQRGSIAAAAMTDPALSIAVHDGTVRSLGDTGSAMGEFLISCWFSTRKFAQSNPEVIRRFDRAIYAAQSYANTHPSETAPILAKYAKMNIDTVHSMTRSMFADQMRVSDIQPFLDIAAKYGTIARPVSAANLIFQP